jgi:hypothetical protein
MLLTLIPATVLAQSPTAAPHPSMPWGGVTTPYGQFVRFVYMAPQPITLEYLVLGSPPSALTPAPASDADAKPGEPPAEPTPGEPVTTTPAATPQVVRQSVTIPGYYVRETTIGYHYPERWAIEQAGPNLYRWRVLPAQFVPK